MVLRFQLITTGFLDVILTVFVAYEICNCRIKTRTVIWFTSNFPSLHFFQLKHLGGSLTGIAFKISLSCGGKI